MRTIIAIAVFFVFYDSLSQSPNEKEKSKLYSLGVKSNLNETITNGDYLNFKNILEFDKKRKTNKTLGIITTSFSVLTTSMESL